MRRVPPVTLPWPDAVDARTCRPASLEDPMSDNPFVGSWSYRSFVNDPDLATEFNKLAFGRGTIVIEEAPMQILKGTIGGTGWSLALKGRARIRQSDACALSGHRDDR
jgi:hypothetical protein